MADYVGSSQQALELCANRCNDQASEIDAVIKNVDSVVNQVRETWKGESALAFEQLWRGDFKGKFEQAAQALRDVASEVQRQARETADNDRAKAAAWKRN